MPKTYSLLTSALAVVLIPSCCQAFQDSTPSFCKDSTLRAALQNIVNRADVVSLTARRIVLSGLRADCSNFDEVAQGVFTSLTFTKVDERFQTIATKYRTIHDSVVGTTVFPQASSAGADVFTHDPLMSLQTKIVTLKGTRIRKVLSLTADRVLQRAAPVLLRPAADRAQFAVTPSTSPLSMMTPFLTDDAIAELQSLPQADTARAIEALQGGLELAVTTTSATAFSNASSAVSNLVGLANTFQFADSRLFDVVTAQKGHLDSLQSAITTLTSLASVSSLSSADKQQEALYASTALGLLQSDPLRDLRDNSAAVSGLLGALGDGPSGVALNDAISASSAFLSEGDKALSDIDPILDFAKNVAHISPDIVDAASTAVDVAQGVLSLGASLASGNVLGAITGIAGMFGLGGGGTEALQAHLDARFDRVDNQLRLGNYKLDALLAGQQQILKDLSVINSKLDILMDTLEKTRADILDAVHQVDYDVLFNRSLIVDQAFNQLNLCKSFLNVNDDQHIRYSRKAAFFASPPSDRFTNCLDSLINLGTSGDLSGDGPAIPSLFVLEQFKGTNGFEWVDSYLKVAKPIVSWTASHLTSCQVNSLTHPDLSNADHSVQCPTKDVEVTAPQPGDPSAVKVANDPLVKRNLGVVINSKVINSFGSLLLGVLPYASLIDQSSANNHLVPGGNLGANQDDIDSSTEVSMLESALFNVNTAIAQQAALGGVMLGPGILAGTHDKPDFRSGIPASCTNKTCLTADFANDRLLLSNLLRILLVRGCKENFTTSGPNDCDPDGLASFLDPVADLVSGKTKIDADAWSQRNLSPERYAQEILKLKDSLDWRVNLIQDASAPRQTRWYVLLEPPTRGPRRRDIGFYYKGMIANTFYRIGLGIIPNFCPISFPADDCTWIVKDGAMVSGYDARYPNQPSSQAWLDFSDVLPFPISEETFALPITQPIPSPELLALLRTREMLAWLLTEYKALDEFDPSELSFLAALDLLPAVDRPVLPQTLR